MPETRTRSRRESIVISPWDGTDEQLAEAAELYAAVFAEPPQGDDPHLSRTSFPERIRQRMTTKQDFRLLLAWDESQVIGLTLGTGIVEGDWWRDRIVEQIPAAAREEWVRDACFAIEELAVAGTHRRLGVADSLMSAVLRQLPYPTAVLSCYEVATRARRFYAAQGWQEAACGIRIGDSPALCILGRRIDEAPRE
ncbi:GNAT family N-acetyltransferase [Microbacterium sp. TWP3-1-2b2]|uniref:GNAT family N-acetyltransferase n=1 Tax=Microbacterium sp. TWP3-1-2b2 TaxID=2804651 RepID=UPI003CE9CEEC